MNVHLGSILHGYSGGRSLLPAKGSTLGAVLDDLDRQCPGLRFRIVDEQDCIRPHIRIFVGVRAAEGLGDPLDGVHEIHILGALSGG